MKIAIDVREIDHREIQKELFSRGYLWGGTSGSIKHFEGIGFLVCSPRNKILSCLSRFSADVLLEEIGRGHFILRTLEEL